MASNWEVEVGKNCDEIILERINQEDTRTYVRVRIFVRTTKKIYTIISSPRGVPG